MNIHKPPILVAVVFAGSALAIAFAASRHQRAAAALTTAHHSLASAIADAREIKRLRASAQTVESRQRPPQDVIAQINAALAEVGIPSQHLQQLAPEADATAQASSGSQSQVALLKQSFRVTLADLTPAQIGAFLVHWQSSQQIWQAERLEIVRHRSGNREDEQTLAANRYDATILMTARYLASGVAANSQETS